MLWLPIVCSSTLYYTISFTILYLKLCIILYVTVSNVYYTHDLGYNYRAHEYKIHSSYWLWSREWEGEYIQLHNNNNNNIAGLTALHAGHNLWNDGNQLNMRMCPKQCCHGASSYLLNLTYDMHRAILSLVTLSLCTQIQTTIFLCDSYVPYSNLSKYNLLYYWL